MQTPTHTTTITPAPKSPLGSPYFRMGMLDGHKLRPQLPSTHHTISQSANPELAHTQYTAGYSAGLDSAPIRQYHTHPRLGVVGGEKRAMTIQF